MKECRITKKTLNNSSNDDPDPNSRTDQQPTRLHDTSVIFIDPPPRPPLQRPAAVDAGTGRKLPGMKRRKTKQTHLYRLNTLSGKHAIIEQCRVLYDTHSRWCFTCSVTLTGWGLNVTFTAKSMLVKSCRRASQKMWLTLLVICGLQITDHVRNSSGSYAWNYIAIHIQ